MALLGNLTVGILGDMKGLSSTFKSAQSEVQKFGKSLQRTGKDISKVGDTLTRRITMPAVAAVSALTGITLVKGFGRLVGIDTAQAKLKALGHDAKSVESIMTSALDSVRGTAFGLDEAATTAANAVAAGISPGKELTRYLSLTGDAAAIAGSSMGEMGSILNKVTTAGKAYNGELQMLADRGLPIYQWLAEEANTTADAIFDMASKGQISTDMLLNAIEKNIGGAAKTMGEESFTAAIANIGADIARIGANFLDAGGKGQGFFSTIKPLLTEFREFLQSLEPVAAELGTKFGQAFISIVESLRDLKTWFDNLSPGIQSAILQILGIGSALLVGIGPALKIVGLLISGFGSFASLLGLLAGPVGIAVAAIAGLIAAGVILYKNWDTVKEKAQTAFTFISQFVQEKLGAIKTFWDENGALFLQAVENVFNGIKTIIGFIMPAVRFIVEMAWTAIKQVIDGALNIIMGLIKVFSGLFTGDWSKLWEGIKQLLAGAIDFIIGLMTLSFLGGIRTILTNLLKSGLNLVKSLADGIVNFFKNFTSTGSNLANSMVNAVLTFFRNLYTQATNIFGMLRTFGASVWNAISQTILGIARNIWNGVVTNFQNMLSGIRSVFSTVKSVIQNIWNGVVNFFRSINLTQIGKDIIQGLINGIGSMASAVWEKAKSIARGIGDSIKKTLGIASPSKLMIQFGKWTGEGMAIGMQQAMADVMKQAELMAQVAIPELSDIRIGVAEVGIRGIIRDRSGSVGLGGITQNITIISPEPTSPSENARKMKQASQQLFLEWGMR